MATAQQSAAVCEERELIEALMLSTKSFPIELAVVSALVSVFQMTAAKAVRSPEVKVMAAPGAARLETATSRLDKPGTALNPAPATPMSSVWFSISTKFCATVLPLPRSTGTPSRAKSNVTPSRIQGRAFIDREEPNHIANHAGPGDRAGGDNQLNIGPRRKAIGRGSNHPDMV